MKKFLAGLAAVAMAFTANVAVTTTAAEAKPAINQIGSRGVAIKGFDPVAYFTLGKPTKGKREFEHKYKGVKWRFANAEHLEKFKENPKKYAPAYGGYCAYGVAQGALVKIEGNAWAIRGGKLYLNYSRGIQKRWNKASGRYIRVANKKFSKLLRR